MSRIIFVSDYFSNEVKRGAETCNEALLYYIDIHETIESHKLKVINSDVFYIITNFINLSEEVKKQLIKYQNYLIYEHDHKYISTRNPFLLPTGEVNITGIVPDIYFINREFYNKAQVVICQTSWHEEQLNKNNILNTTNIHGSLYLPEDLEVLNKIRLETSKIDKYAFFNDAEFITLSNGLTLRQGQNIKNKQESLRYCLDNKLPYFPIPRINVKENFWKTLAKFKHFIFFPDIPETCSRLLIEAKMLEIDVLTNENSGAFHESWFKLSGLELINKFKEEIISNAITLFKGYL